MGGKIFWGGGKLVLTFTFLPLSALARDSCRIRSLGACANRGLCAANPPRKMKNRSRALIPAHTSRVKGIRATRSCYFKSPPPDPLLKEGDCRPHLAGKIRITSSRKLIRILMFHPARPMGIRYSLRSCYFKFLHPPTGLCRNPTASAAPAPKGRGSGGGEYRLNRA